jgi:hypothetical protein
MRCLRKAGLSREYAEGRPLGRPFLFAATTGLDQGCRLANLTPTSLCSKGGIAMNIKSTLSVIAAVTLLAACVPDDTGTGGMAVSSGSGGDISGITVRHDNRLNRASTVSAPTRAGDTALMFRVSAGQCRGNVSFDDCGAGRERSEIRDTRPVPLSQEQWYAVSMFIPAGTTGIDPAVTGLMQWQDTGGSGEITLGLSLYAREGIELVQDDPTTQQRDDMAPPRPMVIKSIVPASQVNNRWHDIRVQAVWSTGADGLINVWLNDRLVHSHRGRNLNRNVAPTFKFGVYRSGLNRLDGPAPTQTVIFDEIRRGSSEAEVSLPAG